MKITISNNLRQAHKKLLLLISVHPEIEESIWIARATLGIRPTDLATVIKVPDNIQKEYDVILKQKQTFQRYSENVQKYEELEKIAGKNLPEILEEDDTGLAMEIMNEYLEYDKQLANEARKIIEKHKLPKAWNSMMKTYISTGNIHLSTVGEFPISIRFPRKYLRSKELGALSMFASDDFNGVNINISEFVYIEDLLKWIKTNKKLLEDLFQAFGYRKYYRPKIADETFDEGLNLYQQRKSNKKYRKIAYEKLSKSEKISEDDGSVAGEADKLIRRKYEFEKTYLDRLSKKSRS